EWMGRRVVVPRLLPCGDCAACRRGRIAHCPTRLVRHELAPRQVVPARWLCSVEPPLWPADAALWQLAALSDAALAPYTAMSRAGVGPSDPVVVVGRDARARFATRLAAAQGAKVIADDGAIPALPAPRAPLTIEGAIVLATSARERGRALSLLAPAVTIVLL